MKKILSLLMCAMVIGACQQKETPEEQANTFLKLSRSSLSVNDFARAKAYIDSLRSKCPTALNARESAIILLDSINIAQSKAELQKMEEEMGKIVNPDKIAKDTLDFYHDEAKEKVRFFERKLQHDIQHKAIH